MFNVSIISNKVKFTVVAIVLASPSRIFRFLLLSIARVDASLLNSSFVTLKE